MQSNYWVKYCEKKRKQHRPNLFTSTHKQAQFLLEFLTVSLFTNTLHVFLQTGACSSPATALHTWSQQKSSVGCLMASSLDLISFQYSFTAFSSLNSTFMFLLYLKTFFRVVSPITSRLNSPWSWVDSLFSTHYFSKINFWRILPIHDGGDLLSSIILVNLVGQTLCINEMEPQHEDQKIWGTMVMLSRVYSGWGVRNF